MRLMKSTLFIFLLIVAATIAPIPSHAQDGGELTEFTSGDVRFVYPTELASSITETAVEAMPFEDGSPIYGSNPAHTEFVFEDFPVVEETRQLPMISIYPTADFEAFTIRDDDPFGYGVELDTLTALLDERPDLTLYTDPTLITTPDALTLPFLPPQYAGQVFRTQAEYIPFDDGWGVRYITYFTQGIAEVREQDLLYTFQGISDDGSTYVAVQFPISSGLLPTEYDPDADLDNYSGYMQGVAALLGEHDPELFDPTLPALDSLILSLSINGTLDYVPMPEATDEPSGG
ncbi:MAG: hypothetical protein K8L91_19215 [Anaerolineae bacterium]|nr:hypothetical protein [Anaerolineae bacterium]